MRKPARAPGSLPELAQFDPNAQVVRFVVLRSSLGRRGGRIKRAFVRIRCARKIGSTGAVDFSGSQAAPGAHLRAGIQLGVCGAAQTCLRKPDARLRAKSARRSCKFGLYIT